VLATLGLVSVGCGSGGSQPFSIDATTVPSEAADSEPSTREVRFQSNGFELVGDLHLPGGSGPHPALIIVHGSGAQTRTSTPTSDLVRRRFVDSGYAVLAWDKPGSGESTGEFDEGYTITQRAEILTDAIEFLADQDGVDGTRIGVWGLSQAGWVIPMALTMTDDVAFMIVVSGGAEDSIEQGVFQWTQQAMCRGATVAELEIMRRHGPTALKAETYNEYREAMEQLLTVDDLDYYIGVDIELQAPDQWGPWPRDIDAFFDPMTVVEKTTIPVLAIFGEHDVQIDPVQGVEAYQEALEGAGNSDFRVETIRGVGHTMRPTEGPCGPDSSGLSKEYLDLIDEWLEQHPAEGT
jgi:pimeloyl-ACP methyl ester carboxylesterase